MATSLQSLGLLDEALAACRRYPPVHRRPLTAPLAAVLRREPCSSQRMHSVMPRFALPPCTLSTIQKTGLSKYGSSGSGRGDAALRARSRSAGTRHVSGCFSPTERPAGCESLLSAQNAPLTHSPTPFTPGSRTTRISPVSHQTVRHASLCPAGLLGEARHALRRALLLDPADAIAGHFLAAANAAAGAADGDPDETEAEGEAEGAAPSERLSGSDGGRASDAFVRQMFDHAADGYDVAMDELEYQVPMPHCARDVDLWGCSVWQRSRDHHQRSLCCGMPACAAGALLPARRPRLGHAGGGARGGAAHLARRGRWRRHRVMRPG